MAQKRRPVNIPLIGPVDAAATRASGRGTEYILVGRDDSVTSHLLLDYLFGADQVRLDEAQIFVNRHEEDSFVVSFHFPSAGKARQVKFRVPIRELLQKFGALLRMDKPHDDESAFVEQALANFEQLLVNFVHVSLSVFEKSAAMLAELSVKHPHQLNAVASADLASTIDDNNDGREEFIVNRAHGWPIERPRFILHDVVRLDPGHVQRDVESGYLVRVNDLEHHHTAAGTVFGNAIAAYRKKRTEEAGAFLRRPAPTDAETFLATSEGRKVRERIVEAFAEVVDRMFPPSPGRPLARTTAEEAALIAEVHADFNRRKAKYVRKGIRKRHRVIYDEMAASSTYGSEHESLSASTIERFMSRKPQK